MTSAMRRINGWVVAMLLSTGMVAGARGRKDFDRRPRLLQAMQAEMKRSREKLKMEGFDTPYFVGMELKEEQNHSLRARYGALFNADHNRWRRLRVEVRVGSYEFDNIGEGKSEFGFRDTPTYRPSNSGPIDDDPLALRNSLWLLTDSAYKAALKAYLKRKSNKITEVDDGKKKFSFSREEKSVYRQGPVDFTFAAQRWEGMVRQASALFENHPAIFDSSITMDAKKRTRLLVNSEGTILATERTIYSISIFGVTRATDGTLIRHTRTIYAQTEDGLPGPDRLTALVEKLAHELEQLRVAPKLEPYTGPAILDGEATGVLFHEVIGHRLEGERQLDDHEGKTFKERIGKQIIPTFLSLYDDPTAVSIAGVKLNGFYRYDDEGVPAQRVTLIDHGILKTFLLSRTPVEDFTKSNGHGRAAAGQLPRARMANTIVASDKQVPFAKLKAMLLEQVHKQGKPYGLIIHSIVGGSTQTRTWGYQAYKGIPEMVYRIWPDGREELVRGVEIVGTPIASINKIIATSDKLAVFNGYCGAESGWVPVSAVAPDVLMTEIELQRTMKQSEKPPLLPSPWATAHPRAKAKAGEKPGM